MPNIIVARDREELIDAVWAGDRDKGMEIMRRWWPDDVPRNRTLEAMHAARGRTATQIERDERHKGATERAKSEPAGQAAPPEAQSACEATSRARPVRAARQENYS